MVTVIRFRLLARLVGIVGLALLACATKGDVAARYSDPEDATVKNGVFRDDYFGLRYPLPPGWVEDLKGTEPSASGCYSLAALKPEGELVATMFKPYIVNGQPVEMETGLLFQFPSGPQENSGK